MLYDSELMSDATYTYKQLRLEMSLYIRRVVPIHNYIEISCARTKREKAITIGVLSFSESCRCHEYWYLLR